MFIFYKMEYVIAYKMLLKESIDEEKKKLFFENVTCLKWEHAILLIFMSYLFGLDDTASLCLKCFFCNANVKYTSTFLCCYGPMPALCVFTEHAQTLTEWHFRQF